MVIGNEAEFNVRSIHDGNVEYTQKMTYVQLGMYLITNKATILRVDIIE